MAAPGAPVSQLQPSFLNQAAAGLDLVPLRGEVLKEVPPMPVQFQKLREAFNSFAL